MPLVLQGSLRHFPPAVVFQLLAALRHTGILDVRSKQRQVHAGFSAGELIFAASTFDKKGEQAALEVFTWDEGSFGFMEEAAVTVPAGGEAIDTVLSDLIEQGLNRAAAWRKVVDIYPHEGLELRVVTSPAADRIDISADELRILMRVGNGKALTALCSELQTEALHLYPTLHDLEQRGLLERTGEVTEVNATAEAVHEAATQVDADLGLAADGRVH